MSGTNEHLETAIYKHYQMVILLKNVQKMFTHIPSDDKITDHINEGSSLLDLMVLLAQEIKEELTAVQKRNLNIHLNILHNPNIPQSNPQKSVAESYNYLVQLEEVQGVNDDITKILKKQNERIDKAISELLATYGQHP